MFTFRPHDIIIDPVTNSSQVRQRENFITITAQGERYYIQRGQVYVGENQPPVSQSSLPGWFWDQVRLLSPQARQTCGMELPEEKEAAAEMALQQKLAALPLDIRSQIDALLNPIQPLISDDPTPEYQPTDEAEEEPVEAPVAPQEAKMWTCPECSQSLPLKHKGVHIGMFRRLGRCK